MRGLLFVSLAVAALAVVQVSAASDSWTDPAGDSNGAPDIRSLYLQDNWIGKKGWMSFQPSTGGFGPGTLTLEIDADSKASTGAAGGSDYRVEWNRGRRDHAAPALERQPVRSLEDAAGGAALPR